MHRNWTSVRRFGLLSVTWTVAGNSLESGDDTWAVRVAHNDTYAQIAADARSHSADGR